MKKINFFLAIASLAIFAACGGSTETKPTDSQANAQDSNGAATTPTNTPATNAGESEKSTTVEINKEGGSMSTEKGSIEVKKEGEAKLEIKK